MCVYINIFFSFFRKKHWKDKSDLKNIGSQVWWGPHRRGRGGKIALSVFIYIVLTLSHFGLVVT